MGRIREKRTEALRALSTDMSLVRGRDKLIEVSMRHVRTFFDAMVGIYLPDSAGKLCEYTSDLGLVKIDRPVNEIAVWAFQNKQVCGLGKGNFADAASLYLPLLASQGVCGVLQVSPRGESRMALTDDIELLENFARQTALCIEVASFSEKTQHAASQIEREQLRNALLSSVSHDLRTPLATITGASSTLTDEKSNLSEAQKKELAQVILEEAEHLNNHVRNLLEMTKLESGSLTIKKKWHSIEETVGACMNRLERQLKGRPIHINLSHELPLVPFDEILLQQVVLNLLENAMKYTPPGSDIDIDAQIEPLSDGATDTLRWMRIAISDRGPGLKPGEEENIFIKFYSLLTSNQSAGVGLGLAICRAIVKAHGGSISAKNREGGGAEFAIRLPLDGEPPASIVDLGLDEIEETIGKHEMPADGAQA
jgi:two-component system sensor histidine kinase KdpD